ncbi:MAG: ExbD/TolR family protein [Chitinophagales bacterium]
MAELNLAVNQNRKAGVRRMKKHNLKTDMTPMVDLGFLLITFFVFTAELSKPMITNLYMPHDGKEPTLSAQSRSITILTSSDNKLFYYYGTEEDAAKNNLIYPTSFDEKSGIGKIIREKQAELDRRSIGKKELFVLIKPGSESSYKNVVDILDEMIINGVTRYAIVKPGLSDAEYLTRNR